MIGQTLAHYEITAQLGKGGMGEVYRARDTKLGRDVAIKILPAEFSDDPERAARFEREARTLASLQHANVAAIYGFEQDQGQRFLVMELVDGQELSDRIAAGAVPLMDAMKIAAQIAEGLEAAHEAGIVHRDLKPANVMLGRDGSVKILDFGLARAYAAEDMSEEERANSPTITAAMTQAGTILGTAAYMSPEQARGAHVDRRADLWALGVILFEMLSGKRLFDGATVSDTLAAVLRAEPEWDSLPDDTPRALRRFIQRCLQRDPRERLRDAGDARLELREILANPRDARPTAVAGGGRAGFVPWLLVLVLAAGLIWQLSSAPNQEATVYEFDINAPVGRAMREFSVSPDGSALVVVTARVDGYRSLWLREFDQSELRELPDTQGAGFPFWSPDSRSVGFFANGKLRRVDLDNENVRTVADAPNGRGGDWSVEDFILFTPEGKELLYRVPAGGGTPVAVTEFQGGENTHRFPHFVPGGTHFSFSAHTDGTQHLARFYRSLDGELQVELPPGMSESYPTDEYLLYVHEGELVAQAFDPANGSLSGNPHHLASGISDVFPRTARSAFSLSHNGVLAYLPEQPLKSHFSWHDEVGLKIETSRTPDYYDFARPSRDLKRVAFARFSGLGNIADLWINDVARGSSRRLIENMMSNAPVGWSHDDASVIYPLEGMLYRHDIDARDPVLIMDPTKASEVNSLVSFAGPRESADGSFIVFSAWDSQSDFDLWRLDRGASEPQRLIQNPNLQATAEISPTDEWVAYVSEESGRSDIYVCGSEAPASGRLISTDGGRNPMWNDDGSKLYYVAPDANLMEVDVRYVGDQIEFGLPRVKFHAPEGPASHTVDDYFARPQLMAVRDGKFLFHTPAEDVPPRVIKVVLNWEERLGE